MKRHFSEERGAEAEIPVKETFGGMVTGRQVRLWHIDSQRKVDR